MSRTAPTARPAVRVQLLVEMLGRWCLHCPSSDRPSSSTSRRGAASPVRVRMLSCVPPRRPLGRVAGGRHESALGLT